MASSLLIGFLFGIGGAAWIYSKLMRRNGGQAKNALIGAAVAGVLIMFISAGLIGQFINK